MEAGADGFEEEIENRATLLGASGDYRPDPLEPALASFATRTLGYVPVDDYEANCLLRQIVGRLDAGCCYEPDVTRAVFLEATGKICRLGCARDILDGCSTQRFASNFQRGGERLGLHEVAAMDHIEQRTHSLQNSTTVRLILEIGMLGQELQISDQVGQTELHQHSAVAHVLTVGTEAVTSKNAVKFSAQNLDQNLGAPRGCDLEHGKERGTETPSPHALAAVFMPGLVHIQKRLVGEYAQQQFVCLPHALAHLGDELGKLAATDGHAGDVTQELANGGE